jgi:hypothetical protein
MLCPVYGLTSLCTQNVVGAIPLTNSIHIVLEQTPLYPVYIRLEDNALSKMPHHKELGAYMQFAPSRSKCQVSLSSHIFHPSQHTLASGTLSQFCNLPTRLQ